LPISLAASDTALSVTPPARELKRSRKKESKAASRPKRENQDPYLEHTPGNRNGRNENILAHEAWRYGAGKHRPSTLLRERERYDANATKKQKKRAEGQKRSSSSFSLDPPLGISHGIPHIRIKTAFSHPIKFNYIPDPLGKSPCSWCDNPFFGLLGHGEKEIEVIPYPDVNGHGYEEMPKGHADNGKERSQMCVICTFKRIKIMACQKHEFEVIDVDPRLEIDGAIEESVQALLEGDEKGGELAMNVAWCSVCPSAAVFRCGTRQADDLSPDVRTQGAESIGCGLYICESCHDLTRKIVKDTHSAQETLDRTINIAAKDRFNYNYGVRADANFLTSSGELMARLQKGFGEIPFEEDEMEEVSEEFEGRR
jgi:hypothetical protein